MIPKNFDDITKADIDLLVDNKTSEIKTLEYKQELPGPKDSDKKEFLADISSFANASGGDVIYGIGEAVDENGKKTGEPEAVVPIEDVNADEAKRRIEDLVRAGIEPRIRIHVKEISGYGDDGEGFVILIRISQSFVSPHMVKFGNTSRFFCRNSAGKYQLDVHEIRNAFLATDSQAERIRRFIQDRLAKIMADETPVRLSTEHRLVLHVLPLQPFLNRQRLQLSPNKNLSLDFRPIGYQGVEWRYNLDGFLTYDRAYSDRTLNDGYCQVFFDGVVESVYADFLNVKGGGKPKKGETAFIASIAHEQDTVKAVKNYFKGYKSLGVEAPAIISMALLGCKGAYMWTELSMGSDYQPIDRDVAILPEVEVASFDEEVPSVVKPIFDAIWNACGFPRSYNYTENGTWNVRQL